MNRLLLIGAILLAVVANGQPQHPRGMITPGELGTIRSRVQQGPYRQQLEQLERVYAREQTLELIAAGVQSYVAQQSLNRAAFLHALTAKPIYAANAALVAAQMLADTLVYNNPMVKGLTRAAVFQAMATAYDLCYDSWPPALRDSVGRSLLQTAFSMHSTMGFEANYALESNWMGVRYGAVLYALMVTDERGRKQGRFHEADMLEWDVRERLRDHIRANMNPGGWSGESLGYHYYNWSFIGPALMAYEHRVAGRGKALPMLAPAAAGALATHATMVAYIEGVGGTKALKPDFSDDNIGVLPLFFLQALRLYPASQAPYTKWLIGQMRWPLTEEGLFYAAAWLSDTIAPKNPAVAGWRNAFEAAQGAIAFRNRFSDSLDIIAAFTATAKRIRAHQSGDNLSFRLMGLDNIWVVGGGRTGLRAGQPTLFPTDTVSVTESYVGGATGTLLRHAFDGNGGGFVTASGSCMGVVDHRRHFRADFDPQTGAAAVFVVRDRSANGRTWRLTTPEWNGVTPTASGFILTAPNGATLTATVVGSGHPVQVRVARVRYNGTTSANASGIPYKGQRYDYIHAVDVPINGNVLVVMTLQPAGKKAPQVAQKAGSVLQVGAKSYRLADFE